jgi:hypothetical protein
MHEEQKLARQETQFDVFRGGPQSSKVLVCTAHPADRFDAAASELLATMTGARVVCINLLKQGATLIGH